MALAFDTTKNDKYWRIWEKNYPYNVYMTINLVNGKRYVGQSRYNRKTYFGSGILITEDIQKYGKENFLKGIICFCSSKKDMDKKEKYYIQKYKTKVEFGGYNLSNGGEGGHFDIETNEILKEIKAFAISKEGRCLSDVYINNKSPLKWKCKCGYRWKSSWDSIKNKGTWCPKCANNLPATIEEIKAFVEAKEGICHTDVYINAHSKLDLECKCGNRWKVNWLSIKILGSWCPKCANENAGKKRLKYKIEDLQDFAKKHNGECLSDVYINNETKYHWKCNKCGKDWWASWSNIRVSWCPCFTIEKIKKFVEKKEWVCHTDIYINAHTKLDLECKMGHSWTISWSNIQRRSWCPKCARNKAWITIKENKKKQKLQEKASKPYLIFIKNDNKQISIFNYIINNKRSIPAKN